MAAKFKAGQKVRQLVPAPIEGVVKRFVLDETTGDMHVLIAVASKDGTLNDRSFREDEVEAV